MTGKERLDYPAYREEVRRAIETCYPTERGNSMIGAGSLIFEIDHNPEKYPLLSAVSSERNKKLILTNVCVGIFGWQLWTRGNGSRRNSAVYRRFAAVQGKRV